MKLKRYAILVAGGSGTRMGSAIPKQFMEINGRPILMHTIDVFDRLPNRPEIIVVLPGSQVDAWAALCKAHRFTALHSVVEGGSERFFSVKNGLDFIDNTNSVVAVHDGVRPLVSPAVVEACYAMAEQQGCAIPVVQPVESIRLVEGDGSTAFPRGNVLLVQTPQVFRTSMLKEAYCQPYNPNFTDDASVVEAFGQKVFTTEGNRENIKITSTVDLLIASVLLNQK